MPDSGACKDIAGYLQHLQTERKLSGHTLDNYRRDLVQLSGLLPGISSAPLAGLTQFDIRRCASQLHARGLSPRSIARKLSAWRGFFAWLALQQPLAANPVDGVKAPKRPKALPKALGVDDAVKLVSAPVASNDDNPANALCSKAIFELLYSSGLRVSELTGLDLALHSESAYHD